MSRKIKSVSFNLNDKYEQEMFEYTKQFPNFSLFVKRLIQNSMSGISVDKTEAKSSVPNNPSIIQNDESKNLMRQLI